MDKIDKQILRSLAANSRTSLKVLAGKVGLAAPSPRRAPNFLHLWAGQTPPP
jgi:DNA-binding Lrp family transcriptional regulator